MTLQNPNLATRYAIVILFVMLMLSCSRKNQVQQTTTPPLTETTKLLVNRYWRETNVLVEQSYPDTVTQDIVSEFPSADRDDLLFFRADGTYRFDEGASKHNESNKQIFQEGQWFMNEVEKILRLTAHGSATTYELLELSETTLVLRLPVTRKSVSYAYQLYFTAEANKED